LPGFPFSILTFAEVHHDDLEIRTWYFRFSIWKIAMQGSMPRLFEPFGSIHDLSTGGLDTRDLKEAKALIDELQ
jgi:hypothetical protein